MHSWCTHWGRGSCLKSCLLSHAPGAGRCSASAANPRGAPDATCLQRPGALRADITRPPGPPNAPAHAWAGSCGRRARQQPLLCSFSFSAYCYATHITAWTKAWAHSSGCGHSECGGWARLRCAAALRTRLGWRWSICTLGFILAGVLPLCGHNRVSSTRCYPARVLRRMQCMHT